MDLFDDLSKFLLSPDENSPAILDGSCKHSVLGKHSWHALSKLLQVHRPVWLATFSHGGIL